MPKGPAECPDFASKSISIISSRTLRAFSSNSLTFSSWMCGMDFEYVVCSYVVCRSVYNSPTFYLLLTTQLASHCGDKCQDKNYNRECNNGTNKDPK